MQPRSDVDAAEAARQVQAHAKTWLVMWSPWHQRFDAWECSDQERCRTVQAPTAGELWDRIQDAELEILWLTAPPYGLPLTPAASREGQPLPVAPGQIPGPNGPHRPNGMTSRGHTPPRRKEFPVLPPYGTPGSDQLNAVRWRPGARTVLQRLRNELHTYLEAADVGDLVHGDRPHFVIRTEPTTVTVWTDGDGEVFCWGTQLMEEPANQAPAEELPQVARQIAELSGKNRTEPAAVPSSRTDACPPSSTPRS